MPKKSPRPPEYCPVCGEGVPANALACPECGADHRSGWCENAGDIDAEDTFNYEEFAAREFGSADKRAGLKPGWWVTAVIVLAAFIWFTIRSFVP